MSAAKRQIVLGIVSMSVYIVFGGLLAAGSPYVFVRTLNVIVLVFASAALCAFIRELALIIRKEKTHSENGDQAGE